MAGHRLIVKAGEGTFGKKKNKTNFIWTDELNATLLSYLYKHHLSETQASFLNANAAKHVRLVHSRLVTEANVLAREGTSKNAWGRIMKLRNLSGTEWIEAEKNITMGRKQLRCTLRKQV